MIFFKFFRIKSDTFEGDSEICESAALMILSEFDRVDPHYTYTFLPANETYENVNEEVGEWEETGEAENDLDENEPRFVAIG